MERSTKLAYELSIKKTIEKRNELFKMLSNDDYIVWLEHFTNIYPQFSINSWPLSANISTFDYSNVSKLCYLFEVIEDYASRNYITAHFTEFSRYYVIENNGIAYMIGTETNTNTTFYCSRKKNNIYCNIIPFHDILANITKPNVKKAHEKFNEIFNLIDTLNFELNLPLSIISSELAKKVIKSQEYDSF